MISFLPVHGVHSKHLRTCGEVIQKTGMHFVNSETKIHSIIDDDESEHFQCSVMVEIPKEICQLRVDLLSFNMSQPTLDDSNRTHCNEDLLIIDAGPQTVYPKLCGENNGQHCEFIFSSHFSKKYEDVTKEKTYGIYVYLFVQF